jgi:3-hydroxybutyrate dehydrogenase
MELDGRHVVVTGAASGIGRAVAERLVADRWRVLAVDVAPGDDGPGDSFAADLTTRDGNRAAVDAVLERFGRIDALVPNAGFQHVSRVEEFDEDRWDALLALLLTSPFLLARYAWPALRESGNGRIVVVAGCTGSSPRPSRRGTSRRSTACSGW